MLQSAARLKVISRLKTIVFKHHFNIADIDYANWSRAVDEQIPTLLNGDDSGFEDGVRNLLSQLKSSHTNFYRSDTNSSLPQHVIGATLRSVSGIGDPRWMFLDVFEDSPAALAGIKPGHFLTGVNGKPTVPPTFPAFRFGEDHHMTVELPDRTEARNIVLTVPPRSAKGRRPPLVEPRSVSHRMLRNIGILKISFFSGAFGIRFSKLLDAAVESLKARGCDRPIIDLRGCLGGSLGFARLVSYLCPDRIPIGYDVTRKRQQRGYNVAQLPRVPMPSTNLGLLFCLVRFSLRDKSLVLLTQSLGKQPFHGRVVMLVNEWTNSAGEMAAQFAKDTKLATIVGKQTRGSVLGSTMFNLGHGYQLHLPIFGWYSPSGSYTEGIGVRPDVPVDIDPE
ncbi:MAG TPA: S41 family peptidase, partial [Terriglobales bacterium]|nr:S41 family peptidase [Terriglobales bacterium]